MTAQILNFPIVEKKSGYKIPLYTDEEIYLTVIAINIFSNIKEKVSKKNLTEYDPTIVIDALVKAKESGLFSQKTKSILIRILKSVEQIELKL